MSDMPPHGLSDTPQSRDYVAPPRVYPPANGGRVLLVHELPPHLNPTTIDHLYNLFGLYGEIVKVAPPSLTPRLIYFLINVRRWSSSSPRTTRPTPSRS